MSGNRAVGRRNWSTAGGRGPRGRKARLLSQWSRRGGGELVTLGRGRPTSFVEPGTAAVFVAEEFFDGTCHFAKCLA